MEHEKILKKIIPLLENLGIDYMLTGGLAVSMWGRPRSTADIDIVLEIQPKDKKIIFNLFKKDFYISEEALDAAISKHSQFNIIDFESGSKVDFYVRGKDNYEQKRFQRKKRQNILGIDVNLISPDDLILIKLLWYKEGGSTRHLEDAESILKISKIDIEYIKQWAKRQNTIKIFDDLYKNSI